jgi:hypothetical protein
LQVLLPYCLVAAVAYVGKGVDISSTLVNFRGRHVVLYHLLLNVIAIYTHVLLVLLLKLV